MISFMCNFKNENYQILYFYILYSSRISVMTNITGKSRELHLAFHYKPSAIAAKSGPYGLTSAFSGIIRRIVIE